MFTPALNHSLHDLYNTRARQFILSEDQQKRLTVQKKRQLKEILIRLSQSLFKNYSAVESVTPPVEPVDQALIQQIQGKQQQLQATIERCQELRANCLSRAASLMKEERKDGNKRKSTNKSEDHPLLSFHVDEMELKRVELLQMNVNELANDGFNVKLKRELDLVHLLNQHISKNGSGNQEGEVSKVMNKVEGKRGGGNEPGKTTKKMSAALASRLASPAPY
jgi:hypothetical protein